VSAAIGQSRIQVTPLQMASVAATVADGGYRMPHFVDQLDNVGSTPLPLGTAATVQSLMRLVVTEGTGKRAAVGGAPVSGKTGTAEFGTADPPQTHAWFISYRGDLATSVLVEDAGFGGEIAAPIAAAFYRLLG
jgi:cell division protein FtsI/penicillin-binding protein 2